MEHAAGFAILAAKTLPPISRRLADPCAFDVSSDPRSGTTLRLADDANVTDEINAVRSQSE